METETKMIQTKDSAKPLVTLATIRRWLTRFAALYAYVPNDLVAPIWREEFCKLTEVAFEAACRKVEQTFKPTSACPFPVPANLRDVIAEVVDASESIKADQAWSTLLRNLQWDAFNPEKLSERTRHAVSAAGGFEYLESCPLSELAWAKKRFIEAYQTFVFVEENQHFIGTSEAKKILGNLSRELPRMK